MRVGAARAATAGVVALGAIGLAAGGASASAMSDTWHGTQDVTGQVFTCAGGDLTVESGFISIIQHENIDNQGVFHMTVTVTPTDVVLSDADGNTYSIKGSQWFGGKALSEDEPILFTDTEHFVIRGASGGVYAKVQAVSHFSATGASFSFDKGSCETPQGD
jgi:hypothetical protein